MPTAETSLAGCRVLVTRPESQAANLMELVRRRGGEPILFPTIEIHAHNPSREQVDDLVRSELVIFISINAVAHGYPVLENNNAMDKILVAIGRATRQALQSAGGTDVLHAEDHASSEALLEHPVMRDVAGQRICIVRGVGGREALAQTLSARGALVSYLECYQRRLPAALELGPLMHSLDDPGHSLVVSTTSVTGLSNLLEMVPYEKKSPLMSCPLVVIGERQHRAALAAGWRGPVLESGAGDAEIVETITKWRHKQR